MSTKSRKPGKPDRGYCYTRLNETWTAFSTALSIIQTATRSLDASDDLSGDEAQQDINTLRVGVKMMQRINGEFDDISSVLFRLKGLEEEEA